MTRVREQDDQLDTVLEGSYSQIGTTCKSTSGSHTWLDGNPVKTGTYRTIRDVVTPDFHKRSARGEVINNYMQKISILREISPASFTYVHPQDEDDDCQLTRTWNPHYGWVGDRGLLETPVGHGVLGIDVGNLQTLAGVQARSQVQSPEVQGLVSVAELRETISFLRNPAKAWVDFAKRARRDKNRGSKLDKAKSTGQFLGDNWLGYRYAARPIVNDVQNVMNALESLKEPVPKRATARGYAEDRYEDSNVISGPVYDTTTENSNEVSVRAGLLYEITGGYDAFGVNASQIPSAVWEVIPFSFVADWFVNIGSYVGAITPKFGVKYLASWTTTRIERVTVCEALPVRHVAPRTLTSASPGSELLVTKSTTRVPGLSFGLAYKPRPYHGDTGAARIIDTLALAQNILRSK